MCTYSKAFSLLEVAIALVIIGFMTGQMLNVLPGLVELNKSKETKSNIELIKESIYGYIIIYNKFPCPDIDGDGQQDTAEDVTGEFSCVKEYGHLPWADLGVGRYDGWNNPFNYAMDKNYINIMGTTPYLITNYEIKNSVDEIVTEPLLFYAVIWSKGRNDNNTADELENRNNDTVFVSSSYVMDDFDDIVVGIPRYIVINRLSKARRLPNNVL